MKNVDANDIKIIKFNGHDYIRKDAAKDYVVTPRPEIQNVIFNGDATIVIWNDGVKTVVHCQDDDIWNDEMGVLECIAKRFYGNGSAFNDKIKKAVKIGNENFYKTVVKRLRRTMKEYRKTDKL